MSEQIKWHNVPNLPGIKEGSVYIFPAETWNNMRFCGCVAIPLFLLLIGSGALGLYLVNQVDREAVDKGCELFSYVTRVCGWK